MRKAKAELRRGFYEGRWLQTFNRNAPGLYVWLQIEKPFGLDRVAIKTAAVGLLFAASPDTIRRWLDEMRDLDLVWTHPVQHGLCIHFTKPGDHTGNEWVPCPETHLDKRQVPQKCGTSGTAKMRHLSGSGAADSAVSGAVPYAAPEGAPLLSPRLPSPENLPQAAAPPRAQGARVGGRTADPTPADVDELMRLADDAERRGYDALAASLRAQVGEA